MNVLTHEEKNRIYSEYSGNSGEFINAIETAVIKRLSAGVSVEPVAWMRPEITEDGFTYDSSFRDNDGIVLPQTRIGQGFKPLYTFAAIAAARVAALEEAAKECDRTASDYKGMFAEDESLYIAATDCAKEIRKLITGQ